MRIDPDAPLVVYENINHNKLAIEVVLSGNDSNDYTTSWRGSLARMFHWGTAPIKDWSSYFKLHDLPEEHVSYLRWLLKQPAKEMKACGNDNIDYRTYEKEFR